MKFHWIPVLGTHSLAWDEAMKISGADSDYHRRDLWEAIESAGASAMLPSGEPDTGVLVFEEGKAKAALPRFVAAIARHRHFERELDPPLI